MKFDIILKGNFATEVLRPSSPSNQTREMEPEYTTFPFTEKKKEKLLKRWGFKRETSALLHLNSTIPS